MYVEAEQDIIITINLFLILVLLLLLFLLLEFLKTAITDTITIMDTIIMLITSIIIIIIAMCDLDKPELGIFNLVISLKKKILKM